MNRPDENHGIFTDFDSEHATREQKIEFLCRIIKTETDKKPEERDNDLIFECSEYLDELSGTEVVISKEKSDAVLAGIMSRRPTCDTDSKTLNVICGEKTPRRRLSHKHLSKKRLLLTIAACIIAILIIHPIAAFATGNGEFIPGFIRQLFDMKPGKVDIAGVTYIKGTQTTEYSDVGELLRSEKLDIMYPGWLPDGIKLDSILKQDNGETCFVLFFIFNDEKLCISVGNSESCNLALCTDGENLTCGGNEYHFCEPHDGLWQAICHTEGYEYTFSYIDKDVLLKILQNLIKPD